MKGNTNDRRDHVAAAVAHLGDAGEALRLAASELGGIEADAARKLREEVGYLTRRARSLLAFNRAGSRG